MKYAQKLLFGGSILFMLSVSFAEPTQESPKWEYRYIPFEISPARFLATLNKEGEEGWELASCYVNHYKEEGLGWMKNYAKYGMTSDCILKRIKIDGRN